MQVLEFLFCFPQKKEKGMCHQKKKKKKKGTHTFLNSFFPFWPRKEKGKSLIFHFLVGQRPMKSPEILFLENSFFSWTKSARTFCPREYIKLHSGYKSHTPQKPMVQLLYIWFGLGQCNSIQFLISLIMYTMWFFSLNSTVTTCFSCHLHTLAPPCLLYQPTAFHHTQYGYLSQLLAL